MTSKLNLTGWWRLAATAGLVLPFTGVALANETPWRLHEVLSAPDWLEIGGSYRVRYEHLDGAFRAGASGSDQLLVERLFFGVQANLDPVYTGFEIQDSRSQLDDAGTPIGTDDINAVEVIRAYVGLKQADVFASGDEIDVSAGRITMDIGSRRLVARNRYRNTTNAFTGIRAIWQGSHGTQAQAFYTLPLDRRPRTRDRLDDNDIANDVESFKVRFWGVDLVQENLLGGLTGEGYVFGLNENDRSGFPTTNRRLLTSGLRLFSAPARGAWDFEIESALQVGESRSTADPTDTRDLDHRAGSVHVEIARTLDVPWSPRLILEYDFASGDDDPNDGENNRFSFLFGVPRGDFGPTGIYTALARSNINSPAARIQIKPSSNVDGFVRYRAVWLASNRDALPSADLRAPPGLRDPSGMSGSFAGHQIEARVRADLIPGNFRLEVGGAYLVKGEFLKTAPNAPRDGDTAYFYTQGTLSF
ncbi:MAG: alginate export family protein [Nitrococcus mobilis]|nr:alginate export family protein [Nitrococcus mobilis]